MLLTYIGNFVVNTSRKDFINIDQNKYSFVIISIDTNRDTSIYSPGLGCLVIGLAITFTYRYYFL